MPNPLAYNSSTTPTGTFKRSNISYGLMPTNYGIGYGSLSWYNSLDTTSKYVIVSDTYTLGLSTQGNAKPVMWSTGNTSNENLINLINGMPGNTTNFTDYYDAVNWLQGTNKFLLLNNGYENIVTNGLVLNLDAAWWNSYPTSATTWTDLSGNNLNGTLTNGPTFNSANGGSIVFDGVDDYGKIPYSNLWNYNNNITLEAWVMVTSTSSNYLGIFGPFDNGSAYNGFNFSSSASSNKLAFLVGGSGSSAYYVQQNTQYTLNTWYHLVGVINNGTSRLYVNGVLQNDSTTMTVSPPVKAFMIGRFYEDTSDYWFPGKIAIGRFYNRVLNQSEITQNYNAQKGRFGL